MSLGMPKIHIHCLYVCGNLLPISKRCLFSSNFVLSMVKCKSINPHKNESSVIRSPKFMWHSIVWSILMYSSANTLHLFCVISFVCAMVSCLAFKYRTCQLYVVYSANCTLFCSFFIARLLFFMRQTPVLSCSKLYLEFPK